MPKKFYAVRKGRKTGILPHGMSVVRKCMVSHVQNIKVFQQWKVQKDS